MFNKLSEEDSLKCIKIGRKIYASLIIEFGTENAQSLDLIFNTALTPIICLVKEYVKEESYDKIIDLMRQILILNLKNESS